MRPKGKFYSCVMRPTMLYGSECWAFRRIEQSMSVEEIRMLRWMSGLTRENKIRNNYVRGSIGVALIVDMIRENRLRLFWHVMRQEKTKAVRVVMKMNVKGKREKGRPKKDGWIRLRFT
jgi:hypothetical protein